MTAFVVVAGDVAEKTLVFITFAVGAGDADVIGKILLYISVVVGTILVLMVFVAVGCATKVNERFIRPCQILFRSHRLEKSAMEEHN